MLRVQLLWICRLAGRPEDWGSAWETLADCNTLAEACLEQLARIEGCVGVKDHDQVA